MPPAAPLPYNNFAYDTILLFFRTIISIFFREVRPRGTFNIPKEGPVIFVAAPHHNQFLDPLILSSEAHRWAGRRVSFLIAAKSMTRRSISTPARLMGSIPVARATDGAKSGTGFVTVSPDDPCLVLGVDTRFKTELAPKKQILLPRSTGSAAAEVVEVLSDTEVRVKKEFGGDTAKGTSKIRELGKEAKEAGIGGLTFKIMPHVDQQQMYGQVYNSLQQGGCIGIFPEGGSHDRTDLLPLKAGVTIMALGAMANNPGLKVKIVPVGLSYFHAHRFRSRAVVEFGHPLDIPDELTEMFALGGKSKREACTKLLDLIYDALKTVTVRAPDFETLMLVQATRRLYKTPGQHLTLGQVVELNRRFIEGYIHFEKEPRIQKLKEDVLRYNRTLRDLGLKDHQVPRAKTAKLKTFGLLAYRTGLLAVWTAFALPGVIIHAPIFIAASVISRKKAKEALAASTVKVAGRDVLATWKILISLGFMPVIYVFWAVMAALAAIKYDLPTKMKICAPLVALLIIPFLGYSALKFGEAGRDVLKSLRPLVIALLPGGQRMLERLKKTRTNISNELSEVIDEFGPRLYGPDFAEWRILVPSASAPPSSTAFKRNNGSNGTDSQGNLLVHPMTWLDERLFGWSRSARRGSNAWAGGNSNTGSVEPSRQGTPDISDDEDSGDYDNVLRYLPGYEPHQPKTRSRQQSYADLQQLRRMTHLPQTSSSHEPSPDNSPFASRQRSRSDVNLLHLAPVYHDQVSSSRGSNAQSPVQPLASGPPPISIDTTGQVQINGSAQTSGRRSRRSSLTDAVHVRRIGELSPIENFTEATQDLNRENSLNRRRGIIHNDDDEVHSHDE
ncbi:hypothetical protein BOTBODRAFT_153041 [Botryobasidium botryosum FD-172 SS1]|uniref:Phospholipid/glycerol acyltransferase domain-containing protein n=1 Tax=Botryobasidium botryosum (strain FD-172 SS1) TaxID=930990 RepID=A0A067N0A5_BOTB1|nr:hypothetical protein BOTBODRAFT_153041 [Botryobasidium botryosum FD-172 SS1]